MDSDTLRKCVREGTAAVVVAALEEYAHVQFWDHEQEPRSFAGYGIQHIERAVHESTVEKSQKLKLIEQYKGLTPVSNDDLAALRAEIAAQSAQIDRLTRLLTAFIEASMPEAPPRKPDHEEQTASRAASSARPRRTLATAMHG